MSLLKIEYVIITYHYILHKGQGMIKKIKTSQLKVGMFVHDFNCSWFSHPFMTNRLLISDQGMVDKVAGQGIKEVYIDTACGMDVASDTPTAKTISPKTAEKHYGTVVSEMPEELAVPGPSAVILDTFEETIARIKQRGVGDEIPQALRIREKAQRLLEGIFSDVRAGRDLDIKPIRGVAGEMVQSAYRNSAVLPCVAKLSDAGDGTLSHSINVCSLMVTFCRQMGMDADATLEAALGGLLHDVGMLKIDQKVLSHPGKMAPEEMLEFRRHADYSHEILSRLPGISATVLDIARHHHERYDGKGYPLGLAHTDIPETAQMACIVDIYDAFTSKTVQKSGLKVTQGMKMLFEISSKGVLNPVLTQAFIRSIGLYPIGTLVRLSSEKVGVVVRQNPESLLKPVVKIIYDLKKDCFVRPRELDFAALPGGREDERIAGRESSSKWNIDLLQYIY